MPFLSLMSTKGRSEAALDELAEQLASRWSGPTDLVVVFFSAHHLDDAEAVAQRLHAILKPRALIGCPGETIVGGDREIENAPALSVWVGTWGQAVKITPYHLTFEQTPDGVTLLGYPDALEEADAADTLVLALGDPFTFPTDEFLQQMNDDKPGIPVVGGMASGGQQPGVNRLLLGDQVVAQGAVGVVLQGDLKFHSIVSQGCRPIGKPFLVTKAHHNIMQELGGKPALGQLQQLFQELTPRDRQLVQQGLHVGRVINEYQDGFQRGDFLVRNVMGIDQESGGIAITDRVRVGQTLQFHVRDADTADEDLRLLLQMNRAAMKNPAAALLFSCNGRGTRFFQQSDHDARAIRGELGPIPLTGFFAMGELGPVGGKNFVHGFTASVVVFEE